MLKRLPLGVEPQWSVWYKPRRSRRKQVRKMGQKTLCRATQPRDSRDTLKCHEAGSRQEKLILHGAVN